MDIHFARDARDLLTAAGRDVTYQESDAAHHIDPAHIPAATDWLKATLPSLGDARRRRRQHRGNGREAPCLSRWPTDRSTSISTSTSHGGDVEGRRPRMASRSARSRAGSSCSPRSTRSSPQAASSERARPSAPHWRASRSAVSWSPSAACALARSSRADVGVQQRDRLAQQRRVAGQLSQLPQRPPHDPRRGAAASELQLFAREARRSLPITLRPPRRAPAGPATGTTAGASPAAARPPAPRRSRPPRRRSRPPAAARRG